VRERYGWAHNVFFTHGRAWRTCNNANEHSNA
jgi:hypothetical protein